MVWARVSARAYQMGIILILFTFSSCFRFLYVFLGGKGREEEKGTVRGGSNEQTDALDADDTFHGKTKEAMSGWVELSVE